MHLINLGFFLEVSVWTAATLLLDPDVRHHPVRALRSIGRLRRSPFLTRRALGRILHYSRQGFHPDDHDTTDLIDQWRTELFGADGTLIDSLAS